MKKLILILALLFCCKDMFAQQPPPFFDEIQNFKIKDLDSMPPKNAILFVGSSSFTKWTDVQDYFPKYTIINRGFGGSTLEDVTYYADQIILPYHAKQIVIYCGENDLAYSDETTPEEVMERFQELFKIIRNNNPTVPVAFISLKPSPSRKHLWVKMKKANQLIKKYLVAKKKTAFINVWPLMFNKDGSIMKDIFVEDDLHMNAKGYHIWQRAILPYLVK
ncbi:MAG: GDSL-type esterase/lipase family protein [Bacteroidota bacterium]